MAVDVTDLLSIADEGLRIGDVLPLRGLFDAIAERWSVTGESPDKGLFPLDIENHPVLADRIASIQSNVLALGERFLCLDPVPGPAGGWTAFPVRYTADVIARFPDMAPVLRAPARGLSCSDEDLGAFVALVRAAATCLSRFRYVSACPYTAIHNATLGKSLTAFWVDPYESYPGSWSLHIFDESYEINGQTISSYDRDGVRNPPVRSVLAEFSAAQWSRQPDPSALQWGVAPDGIHILSSAHASVRSYAIDHETDPATGGTHGSIVGVYGVSRSVGFAVSGVPDWLVLGNPFGYLASALFVFCKEAQPGYVLHCCQITTAVPTERTTASKDGIPYSTVREADGIYSHKEWREYDGVFRIVCAEMFDTASGTGHVTMTDYSDDGSRSRVFLDAGTSRFSHLSPGLDVVRENWVDTFSGVPDSSTATLPAGAYLKTADLFDLDPHRRGVVDMAGLSGADGEDAEGAKSRFGAISDIDPAKVLAQAEGGFSAGRCDASSLRVEAGCRIVPVLDFGPVFRTGTGEPLRNWAGLPSSVWDELHPEQPMEH